MTDSLPILKVSDLSVHFGTTRAVDGVSFEIFPGEIVGLVGESGSGKTVTGMALLGLLPRTASISGEIYWRNQSVMRYSEREWRSIRGRQIGMIFQNAQGSLNPVMSVGRQLVETIRVHHGMSTVDARQMAIDLMDRVRIADPERRFSHYPHQFSLGMCQRVMIAMTVAMRPALMIADEPTASLDVTIQAQIMTLMREVCAEFGMAILIISHDLGMVSTLASRSLVMYWGQLVESGPSKSIFQAPRHPYTQALVSAIPKLDGSAPPIILGDTPRTSELPSGCRFYERCSVRIPKCKQPPPPKRGSNDRIVACHL